MTTMIKVRRSPDWAKKLQQAISARSHKSSVRGVSDCILTTADLIQAYTGEDLAASWRGKYNDDLGALRFIRSFEGGLLGEVKRVMQAHNLVEIAPRFAQRGDPAYVIHDNPLFGGMGIFYGGGILVPSVPSGFEVRPLSLALAAWRIP